MAEGPLWNQGTKVSPAPVLDDAVPLLNYDKQLDRWFRLETSEGRLNNDTWFLHASLRFDPKSKRVERINRIPDESMFCGPNGKKNFTELLYKSAGLTERSRKYSAMRIITVDRKPGVSIKEFAEIYDAAVSEHKSIGGDIWSPRTYADMFVEHLKIHGELHQSLLDIIETGAGDDDPFELVMNRVTTAGSGYESYHLTERATKTYLGRSGDMPEEEAFAQNVRSAGIRVTGVNKPEKNFQPNQMRPRNSACNACGLHGHFRTECKMPYQWRNLFFTLYSQLGKLKSYPTRADAARAFYLNPDKFLTEIGFSAPNKEIPANYLSFYLNNPYLGSKSISAVADLGSPQGVCGLKWLQDFYNLAGSSPPALHAPRRLIKFGANSNPETNLGWLTLSGIVKDLQNKPRVLEFSVDVIERSVPLLISKSDLQAWKTIIHCDTGVFCFDIQDQGKFSIQASPDESHFHIPISPVIRKHAHNSYLSQSQLSKIHVQFGHRPFEEMKRLLQASNATQQEIEQYRAVQAECELCIRRAIPPPSPVVSVPKAVHPGQVLHVDIATIDGHQVLLGIDEFSNLRIPTYLGQKATSLSVIEAFKSMFLGTMGYGIPDIIVLDQESGFIGEQTQKFLQLLGITDIRVVPRNGHFYNGLAETMITDFRRKVLSIMDEKKLPIQEAIPLAALYLNSTFSRTGVTPILLWHGRRPKLPEDSESLSSRPPSEEETRHSAWKFLY
jgi:hypothetical protein